MAAAELISQKEFEHLIRKGVSLIDFNAPWCDPCRAQNPIIAELEKDYSGKAIVAKVNIDENKSIAFSLGIQSIPTIIIFKEGREMLRFIGFQATETLDKALKEILVQ